MVFRLISKMQVQVQMRTRNVLYRMLVAQWVSWPDSFGFISKFSFLQRSSDTDINRPKPLVEDKLLRSVVFMFSLNKVLFI